MSKMIYDELRFLHQNRYFPSPKIMQIEITSICPLHCPQCYTDDLKSNVMDVEQYFRIIEEAKNIGVGAITLLGGEPFTHPHICEMINALDKTGIIGGTYTSGYGLNDDVISTLKNVKNPFYLFLSLNGSTKQVHELSRDEFNLTFNSMKYLKEQHVDYIINWVARHDNIGDLCNVITLSKMYGAKYLNVVCNKINTYGVVESPMSREDYKVLKELFSLPENRDFLKFQNCYGILKNYLDISRMSMLSGCQAGVSVCAVNAVGEYFPCLHLNYGENYNSIMDYWENSSVLAELRGNFGRVYDSCISCKYREGCRFCRAMSIETHDNFKKGLINCPVGEMVYE